MYSLTILSSLILSYGSWQTVTAAPNGEARTSYPRVVPGPGLPSLESLGLTTAQLYEMPLPKNASDEVGVNFVPRCGPSESAYANVNGVIACYNYLKRIGQTRCPASGNAAVSHFCYAGDAEVSAQSISGKDESSSCSDVATGVLWIVDHCTRGDQTVAGFNSAAGNGNLIVGGANIRY
ncbi:hypothetical protein T440DRAFT_513742 [Plenodomus tracheiphilus IPT5]|uniref:Ecp2 effector protein domain-containing protein n=1 Tax=Plenodomus tracheiphilus IPT5 TaxID=1408161 RepID=A0A6A7BNE6_9PLEO|nr:hypothetical protein T440DRAFT_513742 [Plenodomus tracheiphilus IPT5]